jgi:hypothetical protein
VVVVVVVEVVVVLIPGITCVVSVHIRTVRINSRILIMMMMIIMMITMGMMIPETHTLLLTGRFQ